MNSDKIKKGELYWEAESIEVKNIDIGPHVAEAVNIFIGSVSAELTLNLANYTTSIGEERDKLKGVPGFVITSNGSPFHDEPYPLIVKLIPIESMLEEYLHESMSDLTRPDNGFNLDDREAMKQSKTIIAGFLDELAAKYRDS